MRVSTPDTFLLPSDDKNFFINEFFEIVKVNILRLHHKTNRDFDLGTIR
jgi:hypothetical protein